MTCIVGLVDGDRVWIGGDGHCDAGCPRLPRLSDNAKVFRRGPFLFGVAGATRTLQILRHVVQIPAQGHESDIDYLVTRFLPAFKEAIDGHGGISINDGSDTWSVLFGYRGRLWDLCFDLALTEIPTYGANGCGRGPALGSLYSTDPERRCTIRGAEDRVRMALEAAAAHDVHVAAPFILESVG